MYFYNKSINHHYYNIILLYCYIITITITSIISEANYEILYIIKYSISLISDILLYVV